MPLSGNEVISFDPTGISSQVKSLPDIVKSKIKRLLSTRKGEYPDNLNYGVNIHMYVLYPATPELLEAMRTDVNMALSEFLPYVIVRQIVREDTKEAYALKVYYNLMDGYEDMVDITVEI